VYLSITASPGVRGITITRGDRILVVHLYAKSVYMAVVSRGCERVLADEELKRAAWLLTRLMDRVGRLVKSRYYTYTGPLEVREGEVVFRPYVAPTSAVEVVLRGGKAAVFAGEWRRRFRTGVDVAAALKRGLELLRPPSPP